MRGSFAVRATVAALLGVGGAHAPESVLGEVVVTASRREESVQKSSLAVDAPEWSGSAGYARTFGLGNGARLVADVSGQFASRKYLTADFVNSGSDDGYVSFDAALTYHAPSDNRELGAWGRNLGNEAIYTGGFRYPFSSPVGAGGDPTFITRRFARRALMVCVRPCCSEQVFPRMSS